MVNDTFILITEQLTNEEIIEFAKYVRVFSIYARNPGGC
jgi:hypothetical protein